MLLSEGEEVRSEGFFEFGGGDGFIVTFADESISFELIVEEASSVSSGEGERCRALFE